MIGEVDMAKTNKLLDKWFESFPVQYASLVFLMLIGVMYAAHDIASLFRDTHSINRGFIYIFAVLGTSAGCMGARSRLKKKDITSECNGTA